MIMNQRDLTNQKFGRLLTMERTNQKKGNCYLWQCKCDCGNITLATTYALTHGIKRSCGCLVKEVQAYKLVGQKFGRLAVICESPEHKMPNKIIWECLCDCGKTVYVSSYSLVSGIKRSCGCLHNETAHINCKDGYKVNLIDGTNLARITSKLDSHNTSGTKGVSWHKSLKKWQARTQFKGKNFHLGYLKNFDDAAKVRKEAEERLFGEYLSSIKDNDR
jgi:hypothetical protein